METVQEFGNACICKKPVTKSVVEKQTFECCTKCGSLHRIRTQFESPPLQPTIIITIETENAAFMPDWEIEVARILSDIADEIGGGPRRPYTSHKIMDSNGKSCGVFDIQA